jgi:hypothetical protein
VRADHQHRRSRQALEHDLARALALFRIGIRRRRPFGMRDLTGVVHEVAGYQCFLAA